jgi:hypothetical protein
MLMKLFLSITVTSFYDIPKLQVCSSKFDLTGDTEVGKFSLLKTGRKLWQNVDPSNVRNVANK